MIITDIDNVEEGMFIKYSDRDKSGKITYVGEVTLVDKNKELFEMLTFDGEMGFILSKDDENKELSQFKRAPVKEKSYQQLEIIKTKPKGWAKFKKNPSAYIESNKEQVKQVKTLKQTVFEIVKKNPRKKMNALLKLSSKETGETESKLRTIIQLAMLKL